MNVTALKTSLLPFFTWPYTIMLAVATHRLIEEGVSRKYLGPPRAGVDGSHSGFFRTFLHSETSKGAKDMAAGMCARKAPSVYL